MKSTARPNIHRSCKPICLMAIVAVLPLALPQSALAVKTNGSTYAKKTGGTLPVTDSDSHSKTHLTFSSTSSRSDANSVSVNAHAQSWATAQLSGGVLTKSSSGTTFFESGADTKSATFYSYASGTTLQVNSALPTVQMVLIVRDSNNAAIAGLDARPLETNPLLPSVPESFAAASDNFFPNPHQELYLDSIGTADPSFFDVFVDLRSSFSQAGTPPMPLLNGRGTLNHLPNGVDYTENFLANGANPVDVFTLFSNADFAGIDRHIYRVGNDVAIPFQVLTNQPFDVQTDLFMSMGYLAGLANPDAPIDDTLVTDATFGSLLRPVGGGGSLIVQLEILQTQPNFSEFTLTIVPEPSGALLAAMAIAGLAAFRQKHRRSKGATDGG